MSYNIVCGSRVLSIILLFINKRPSMKLNYKLQIQKSELLCLKESEQSYYAFLCSELLTVTGNQMILNYDLMYRQECI